MSKLKNARDWLRGVKTPSGNWGLENTRGVFDYMMRSVPWVDLQMTGDRASVNVRVRFDWWSRVFWWRKRNIKELFRGMEKDAEERGIHLRIFFSDHTVERPLFRKKGVTLIKDPPPDTSRRD